MSAWQNYKKALWYGPGKGNKPYRRMMAKKASMVKSARLATRINRLEKGITGKEWKTHDVDVGQTTGAGGAIQCLTLISEGDESVQREGLVINLQSVAWRFRWRSDYTYDMGSNVRWILFWDLRSSRTAVPNVTDVLEAASPDAFKKIEAKTDYIILKDKCFSLNPNIADASKEIFQKGYKKLKGRRAFYTGTGATIGNSGKGMLMLMVICTNAGNYPPNLNGTVRFKFTG